MPTMETLAPWRQDWRTRLAPQYTRPQLLAMRQALRDDDPRLSRFSSTLPPAVFCFLDRRCDSCCLLLLPFLAERPDATVLELSLVFERLTQGRPSAFVDFWDDASVPRTEAVRLALTEVERSLSLPETPPCP